MKTFQCQFQVFEFNSAKQTGDITHPIICKEFDLIVLFQSYYCFMFVKKNWKVKVELETNTTSLSTDPYACAIKTKNPYFNNRKTVGHIPHEISCYVYFFIKEENGNVSGTLKSLKYKSSPIPSGGLEVPLLLKFSAKDKWVVDTMEEFVLSFYSYEHSGNLSIADNEDDNDYQVIMIESEETNSHETEA